MTQIVEPTVTVLLEGGSISAPGKMIIINPEPENGGGEIFDNTYWEADSGLQWNAGQNRWENIVQADDLGVLVPITSGPNLNWQSGFRPTNAQVTVNSGDYNTDFVNVELRDTNLDPIGFETLNFTSLGQSLTTNMSLTFGAFDIGELEVLWNTVGGGNTWFISNIVFS